MQFELYSWLLIFLIHYYMYVDIRWLSQTLLQAQKWNIGYKERKWSATCIVGRQRIQFKAHIKISTQVYIWQKFRAAALLHTVQERISKYIWFVNWINVSRKDLHIGKNYLIHIRWLRPQSTIFYRYLHMVGKCLITPFTCLAGNCCDISFIKDTSLWRYTTLTLKQRTVLGMLQF